MKTTNTPPQPTTERISSLNIKIQQGDIKVPKFQRGFIWKPNQVLSLLESIYKGYPVGSLLFWLTEEKMTTEKEIGNFELPPTPEKYPTNYILDGQQRLTTIYGVLNWKNPTISHILNIYYDLENKQFYHYVNGEKNLKSIPLGVLFDTKKFLDAQSEIRKLENGDSLNDELVSLFEIFKEYLIPVVTIKERTVEDVCPVFERINSTGTQLDIFDLMVAATWKKDFDLNDSIKAIRESTKLKDFENVSNSAFLKLMARINGLGAKREAIFKLRHLKADALKESVDLTKACIERAVDFLATDLNVPSDTFLPYENQLLIIAYLYSKVKNPNHTQLKTLRKWFWQSGFSEHFRGAPDNVLEKDFLAIDELIKNDIDEQLLFRVSLMESDVLKRQFSKNSAFSKTFVVMLACNSPKNITNGQKIDVKDALSVYNKKEFHHIYPQEYLRKSESDYKKKNSICNICMLGSLQNKIISDEDPNIYLTKLISDLGEHADEVLKSNLLPNARDIELNNFTIFLEERAKIIVFEINRLCN